MSPYKAKHPCKYPGCPNLVESGQSYCPEHQKKNGAYTRRHPEYSKLYNNKRWAAFRRMYLREHPLCALCGGEATIVDHIKDHQGDWELFWSLDNLQSLCKQCHDKKTARTRGWGRVNHNE